MATEEPSIADVRAAVDWLNYDKGLREANRYVASDQKYFADLLEGCLACRFTMPTGSEFFRARIMPVEHETDSEPLNLTEMGAPPPEHASASRLNPEGISCFYAAMEEDTAIAEVRPWNSARLSVARFLTKVPLDTLDLTGVRVDAELLPSVRFAAHMISRPIHRDDRFAYLGTQYLAESLKSEGVRGLLYRSSLRPGGTNVALFTEYGLRRVSVALHEVTSVTYATSLLAP